MGAYKEVEEMYREINTGAKVSIYRAERESHISWTV
jgi:hypothetical protein